MKFESIRGGSPEELCHKLEQFSNTHEIMQVAFAMWGGGLVLVGYEDIPHIGTRLEEDGDDRGEEE
jgi:hypothetical protein